MVTPVFNAAYDKVADRDKYMSMLGTLLPQWESNTDALREHLRTEPDVHPELRLLAHDDVRWAAAVSSSRSHQDSRSSLPAARAIAESAVRILRPLPADMLDKLPRLKKNDPDSGPNLDALLKARVVTAYVLKMQLDHFGKHEFPYIHMENVAAHFVVERHTVRAWFQWATDIGLLYEQQAPARRSPGKWNVTKLGADEAPLTPEEDAIAAALAGKWSQVAADGSWGHLAADVLMSVSHVAWHQYPKSVRGLRQWWAVLQVAAKRPMVEVSTDDERLAARLAIRRISDVEALVTADGQARHADRGVQRGTERDAQTAWHSSNDERNTDAWSVIRGSLGWTDWTADNLLAWAESAVSLLAAGNRRGWETATEEKPGSASDARASTIRDSLLFGIKNSKRFRSAPDKDAALALILRAPLTRAERNLAKFGWGAVQLDELEAWVGGLILRLADTSDTYLEESIRSTLRTAIRRDYPPSDASSAALHLLKGAA